MTASLNVASHPFFSLNFWFVIFCCRCQKSFIKHIITCLSFVSPQPEKRAVTVSLPRLPPATLPWPSLTSLRDSTQPSLFPCPQRPTQAGGHQTTLRLCSARAWSPSRPTPTRPTRGPSTGQAASTALAHPPRSKSLKRKRRVSPCLPN